MILDKPILAYLEDRRALCVAVAHSLYKEPIMRVHYWLLQADVGEHYVKDLPLGAELYERRHRYSFEYSLTTGPVTQKLGIVGEGQQTLLVEDKPYPCPKVRKGTKVRYHAGQWQKYLKTEGWVKIDSRR